ncbi:4Fe-4S dicluster domain protein [Xanthomonas sp. GW]|uniref:4Fe-4S dicluster domain-containing protein n=1 Tax=Xanthomonas sp. GW TaxID=2724121 RepID=UPI00163AF989|nr:4Fe-4S dicluster domain-containing protein [Xanthomonas sp. GW]QNH21663.1 4Fe-4S dicluster domain protein [Xanthomonas sp. GW]
MPRRIPLRTLGTHAAADADAAAAAAAPHGRYARLRRSSVWLLFAAFYLLPWLRWDGRQALRFDLPARRLDLFGWTLWPHDVGWLLLALFAAAAALMVTTTLAGRVWCGFACPQSVWSHAFAWLERRFAAWPAAARHVVWAALALWTGISFVGYFAPIVDLVARLRPFAWSGWESFWVLFYALATWGNAGFLRSQVCRYLCPYARLQPLLCDRDTPLIGYDAMRGEPRGARACGQGSVAQRGRRLLDAGTARDYALRASIARRAGQGGHRGDALASYAGTLPKFTAAQLGDCVDCSACVDACPARIDLRNGPHYACTACGACVDACDRSMDRHGFAHGLLRWTGANAIERQPRRRLRPRLLAGAALLLGALLAALLAAG